MNEQDKQAVKEVLNSLLTHMGIEAHIEERLVDDTVVFNIRTEDSALLIGQHGVNLSALQHLVRVLCYKKLENQVHIVLDVEDYKKSREEFLKELARQAADRVMKTRERLFLKPMSSYERRVVHEAVSGLSDVTTESTGEEPERRVVIKPKE